MSDLEFGAKNEEFDEDQHVKNISRIAIVSLIIAVIFVPTSLVFYFKYQDNDCNVDIPGTSIDILTWHLVYVIALIVMALLSWGGNYAYPDNRHASDYLMGSCVMVMLFVFVWSIILWIAVFTILPECKNTDAKPLYDYSFWGILILITSLFIARIIYVYLYDRYKLREEILDSPA